MDIDEPALLQTCLLYTSAPQVSLLVQNDLGTLKAVQSVNTNQAATSLFDDSKRIFGGPFPVSYTHLDVYKRQENTHLKRCDAQHGGGGVGRHSFYTARRIDHGLNGRIHNDIGHCTGQCRDLFFLASHADGYANGEQKRQICLLYTSPQRSPHSGECLSCSRWRGFPHG